MLYGSKCPHARDVYEAQITSLDLICKKLLRESLTNNPIAPVSIRYVPVIKMMNINLRCHKDNCNRKLKHCSMSIQHISLPTANTQRAKNIGFIPRSLKSIKPKAKN